MRRIAAYVVLALVSPLAGPQPQLPPNSQPLSFLCSAIKNWHIRLTEIEVQETPNDWGSHEEWVENFMLWGNGPLSAGGGFQAKGFHLRPHDEIPDKHLVEKFVRNIGPLVFSNTKTEDKVVIAGHESDAFPNPDDDLPDLTINISNPCKASGVTALTSVTELVKSKTASNSDRKAKYTITMTPIV